MIIQQINRDDPDKVWVTVINRQGATLTTHWPVSKFGGTGNSVSVATAEVALPNRAVDTVGVQGTFVGLMDEDLANDNTGLAQAYGYHASVLCGALNAVSMTLAPGTAMSPLNNATVGFTSLGADNFGPVVCLNTLALEFTLNIAGSAASYGDHVFIRNL